MYPAETWVGQTSYMVQELWTGIVDNRSLKAQSSELQENSASNLQATLNLIGAYQSA